MIEASSDIALHEPLRANPAVVDLVQRGVAAAGWAEAVRGRAELRLVVGLEDEAHHLLQQLQPLWDPTFSEHSYGFRPGRSAHQAVAQAQAYVSQGRNFSIGLTTID